MIPRPVRRYRSDRTGARVHDLSVRSRIRRGCRQRCDEHDRCGCCGNREVPRERSHRHSLRWDAIILRPCCLVWQGRARNQIIDRTRPHERLRPPVQLADLGPCLYAWETLAGLQLPIRSMSADPAMDEALAMTSDWGSPHAPRKLSYSAEGTGRLLPKTDAIATPARPANTN